VGWFAVDVDLSEAVSEVRDPGLDPFAAGAEAFAEPVLDVSGGRRPVRAEAKTMVRRESTVRVRQRALRNSC
jgi:hypothetical protein